MTWTPTLTGLPDWKELLLGTNPYDVDTDDDGIQDGVAINTSLRILEEADESIVPNDEDTVFINDTISQTDRVGRELYTIVQLLETTDDLTQEQREEITKGLEGDLLAQPEYNSYDFVALNPTIDSDPIDELDYINKVFAILENYNLDSPNPPSILLDATEGENERQEFLEKGLVLVLENHKETLDALLNMMFSRPTWLTTLN